MPESPRVYPTIGLFIGAVVAVFATQGDLSAKALPGTPGLSPRAAETNDNRKPAGRLVNGTLTIHLEAREIMWYPEGKNAPGIPNYGFSEMGKNVTVPGPLIRVPAGTVVRAIVHNALPKMMRMRGLEDRGSAAPDTFDIPAGATRELTFRANTPGTFFYWGRTEENLVGRGVTFDSQLMGALIVDPPGVRADPRERVLVLTLFEDTLRTIPKPDEKEVFAINGHSWPFTERLTYTVGDTVRWRVINFTVAQHPMHLHGFYFDVDSKGNAARDTVYTERQRRKVVTEAMGGGTTMKMSWIPTRPGNWLFHCHLIFHIDASLKLADPHTMAGHKANHAEDGMAGLIIGLLVKPKTGSGLPAEPVALSKMRVYVNERANVYDGKPGYAFVLQEGKSAPAPDSIVFPSSTVVVRKGEPTEITVVNRTREMVSVHWHGIELNSYYDGVGDWSGWKKTTAPVIAPSDSFVVRMTPDRAGTFIYHTHVDETVQLTSGLYGPLLVIEKGQARDTAERIFLLGDGGPQRDKPKFVNGTAKPGPVNLSAGHSYRFRFISISAGATKRVRILSDTTLINWRPIAKDGADLPPTQSTPRPADLSLMVGETVDVEMLRGSPEELTMEIMAISRAGTVVTKIPVRVR